MQLKRNPGHFHYLETSQAEIFMVLCCVALSARASFAKSLASLVCFGYFISFSTSPSSFLFSLCHVRIWRESCRRTAEVSLFHRKYNNRCIYVVLHVSFFSLLNIFPRYHTFHVRIHFFPLNCCAKQ